MHISYLKSITTALLDSPETDSDATMLVNYRGKREGGRERDTGKLNHYWKER